MAMPRINTLRLKQSVVAGNCFIAGHAAYHYRPASFRSFASNASLCQKESNEQRPSPSQSKSETSQSSSNGTSPLSDSSDANAEYSSMPPDWEDDPDLTINSFSQLPHRYFGTNQHIKINEDFKEALRNVLWQFRAPIRYAFAYGSGVFSQSTSPSTGASSSFSPHPHPPEAVSKWQEGGGKIIDFIFGVSHTQHWHSLNMQQHPEHYSGLRHLGSWAVSKVQDNFGAGAYFNPYITVNGIMIKYGVVNLDTICRDLSTWDTLYLAGRLQKPVKILRDDPRVRLANQMNLMSAVRTALLMLPERFTEKQLYEQIASLSYMGDPRMNAYVGGENPKKVANIVGAQLPNFRQLYVPLVDNLPNVDFNDSNVPTEKGWEKEEVIARSNEPRHADEVIGGRDGFVLQQDMDPRRRGNMVRRLPKLFRQKLYYEYQKKFGIQASAFDRIIDEANDEDATSIKRREGGEFEQRIGAQPDIKDAMSKCIQGTVAWPSTIQTLKGPLTAGVGRSWKYYSEKRAKSRQGKAQKVEDETDKPSDSAEKQKTE
ncbi:hypothetical protein AAFC00_004284 [Neodothiora populina]|uniref:Phosphatidate cytidylyltransferase, mitochondrial n=1 Tax=Neodothiora populina TaxID=2781224 RepID=A0ABR3PJ63_9PEZI